MSYLRKKKVCGGPVGPAAPVLVTRAPAEQIASHVGLLLSRPGLAPAGLACVLRDGDLACPWCACTIVTPDSCVVLPGTARCPRCRRSFKLTRRTARQCNKLKYLSLKTKGAESCPAHN